MTLPRPRSDRLGSEGSSIMNGLHHHHPLIMTSASGDPQLTNSISAYNNQDVWTPIQTHRYYSCLCLHFTMGKFDYFSIPQTLRVINYLLIGILEVQNLMNFSLFLQLKFTKLTQFRAIKWQKMTVLHFLFSISKINFT